MIIPKVEYQPVFELNEKVRQQFVDQIAHLNILGPVLLQCKDMAPTSSQSLLEEVVKDKRIPCILSGIDMSCDEVVKNLLDRGLGVAFVDYSVTEIEILKKVLKSFPKSRIGIALTVQSVTAELFQDVFDLFSDDVHHFLFRLPSNLNFEDIKLTLNTLKKVIQSGPIVEIYFDMTLALTESEIATLAIISESIHIICYCRISSQTSLLITDPFEINGNEEVIGIDYIAAYIACLRTDRPDKMFTTVVCDEHGVCLGLVYSNEESIRTAVWEKRGIYWSRSRSSLWKKGESSGMVQELLSVKYDCDRDALQFNVFQKGNPPSFCHLMTRTCWGEVGGIQKLEQTLIDRKISSPEGSYTKRLFDDPVLLQKKLLEEVQELVEAVDPDHVAAEAADVLYFMMTRCVAAGVGMREIEAHLDKRAMKVTRRPGNAKEWRTEQAMKVLETTKEG